MPVAMLQKGYSPANDLDAGIAASDRDLLRSFLSNDREARERSFEKLVRRHSALVYGLCRRKLRDNELADDATQAVFIVLARKAPSLQREGSLAGWLYRTAEWVSSGMKRDRRTRIRHEGAAKTMMPRIDTQQGAAVEDDQALKHNLADALLQLKPADREAVLLHYLQGVPQQKAARRMGLSHPAYRQKLSRALGRLRSHFGSRGNVLSEGALATALISIRRADLSAARPEMQVAWAECALEKSAASDGVENMVKGVMRKMSLKMFIKNVSAVLGLIAIAWLGVASALAAADVSPVTPPKAAAGGATKPLAVPAARHRVLDGIKGIGTPVFSPDGKWLAVRERGNKLALIDLVAVSKDATTEPIRFDLAPGVQQSMRGGEFIGQAAMFSNDSDTMIFTGRDNLMAVGLPPKHAPIALRGESGDGKAYELGTNFVPAGKYAGSNDHAAKVWPLFKILEGPQAPKPGGEGSPAKVQLITLVLKAQNGEVGNTSEGPRVALDGLRWSADLKQLFAVLDNGDAAVVNPWLAKVIKTFEKAAFEKDLGKELAEVRIVSVAADGKTVIEATRLCPPQKPGGRYIGQGDEAPERGSNPGSAEPAPPMPRYLFSCENGKRTRICMASVARCLDTLWVLPAAKQDKYFFFQAANLGGAGGGEPHAWLGQLDASGKRTEKDLGNPFGKTVDAPTFELLSLAPDASKAIVLMRADQIKTIETKLDEATRKQIKDNLQNGKVKAVHRDGPEALMKMLASGMAFQKYGRGGSYDEKGNATLRFATWQVLELDAVKQSIQPLTPAYGEAIGELHDVIGAPGAVEQNCAYNANGWLAVNLCGQTLRQMLPGAEGGESRGLMLIQTK